MFIAFFKSLGNCVRELTLPSIFALHNELPLECQSLCSIGLSLVDRWMFYPGTKMDFVNICVYFWPTLCLNWLMSFSMGFCPASFLFLLLLFIRAVITFSASHQGQWLLRLWSCRTVVGSHQLVICWLYAFVRSQLEYCVHPGSLSLRGA